MFGELGGLVPPSLPSGGPPGLSVASPPMALSGPPPPDNPLPPAADTASPSHDARRVSAAGGHAPQDNDVPGEHGAADRRGGGGEGGGGRRRRRGRGRGGAPGGRKRHEGEPSNDLFVSWACWAGVRGAGQCCPVAPASLLLCSANARWMPPRNELTVRRWLAGGRGRAGGDGGRGDGAVVQDGRPGGRDGRAAQGARTCPGSGSGAHPGRGCLRPASQTGLIPGRTPVFSYREGGRVMAVVACLRWQSRQGAACHDGRIAGFITPCCPAEAMPPSSPAGAGGARTPHHGHRAALRELRGRRVHRRAHALQGLQRRPRGSPPPPPGPSSLPVLLSDAEWSGPRPVGRWRGKWRRVR